MKKISHRAQSFIDISKLSPYSREEFKKLHDTFQSIFYKDPDNSYALDMMSNLYWILESGYIYDTLSFDETDGFGVASDTHFYELNFLQYLLLNHKRVFLFLTQVPLNRVPLYINDQKLSLFAKWRLTINK